MRPRVQRPSFSAADGTRSRCCRTGRPRKPGYSRWPSTRRLLGSTAGLPASSKCRWSVRSRFAAFPLSPVGAAMKKVGRVPRVLTVRKRKAPSLIMKYFSSQWYFSKRSRVTFSQSTSIEGHHAAYCINCAAGTAIPSSAPRLALRAGARASSGGRSHERGRKDVELAGERISPVWSCYAEDFPQPHKFEPPCLGRIILCANGPHRLYPQGDVTH